LTREFKQTDDPIRQHIAKVMMSFLAIIGVTIIGVSSVFNENRTDTELFPAIRLVSLPGFYWTYDLCRHSKRLAVEPNSRLSAISSVSLSMASLIRLPRE
jgi:hypothetical protein